MIARPGGFTLTELIVAIVIATLLAAGGLAAYRCAAEKARTLAEVNAARQLVTAYLSHASDRNGQLLPGYDTDPAATNLQGKLLHHPVNARYPWRLAPYAPRVEGVLLVNGNERLLDEADSDYLVSVRPNLGINAVYIGGHFGSGSPLRPSERLVESAGKYYVSRLSEAVAPEKLIVFTSARSGRGADGLGHFEVRAPNFLAPQWSSARFDKSLPPADHGFVDLRWNGRAVAASLAGGVELLDESQFRDMRRWSNQAARLNDPDFVVQPR